MNVAFIVLVRFWEASGKGNWFRSFGSIGSAVFDFPGLLFLVVEQLLVAAIRVGFFGLGHLTTLESSSLQFQHLC